MGETRPLEEIPGHLFSSSEREDATSLLILGIEFYWDVLIVEPTGKRAFFFSHDEYLRALAKDGDILKKINESLIAAKFKTP